MDQTELYLNLFLLAWKSNSATYKTAAFKDYKCYKNTGEAKYLGLVLPNWWALNILICKQWVLLFLLQSNEPVKAEQHRCRTDKKVKYGEKCTASHHRYDWNMFRIQECLLDMNAFPQQHPGSYSDSCRHTWELRLHSLNFWYRRLRSPHSVSQTALGTFTFLIFENFFKLLNSLAFYCNPITFLCGLEALLR